MVLPVVDSFLPETEQYLPRDPKEVLETGNYATMPVLTGTTRHEGAVTLCEYRCVLYENTPYCITLFYVILYYVMLCYVMLCYVLDAQFYIFIQQISVLNISNMLYNLHFILFKMPFIS